MARRNFLLHGSAGKVGSVVTYKSDGKQIVRALPASVANPRTASQSNTRALFAPAAKFYSPLSVVLEKSFEGLNKVKSYTAFLKKAIDDAIANGWYLPKGTGFFPLPYQLSKGTVIPISTRWNEPNGELRTQLRTMATNTPYESFETIAGLSQFFIEQGYNEGDQITFIGIVRDDEGNFYPIADRFILSTTSTVLVTDVISHFDLAPYEKELGWIVSSENVTVAGAVIVSRYENNVWRRSNTRLVVNPEIMENVISADGRDAAISSYMDGSSNVQSDVYLNGSTGTNGGSQVKTLALSDGRAATPLSLRQRDGLMYVSCRFGNNVDGLFAVATEIRNGIVGKWLTSATTSGTLPEGATVPTVYIDGTDADWQAALQTLGVSASVFQ